MNKDKTCTFTECARVVYARGHCKRHYETLLRGGELRRVQYKRPRGMSAWEEIECALAAHGDSDECLTEGAGYLQALGYRHINEGGRSLRIHRLVAEKFLPGYSPDMPVHHTCAVRACFNPRHLQMLDHRENTAEMKERHVYLRRIANLEERVVEMEWEYFLRGVPR